MARYGYATRTDRLRQVGTHIERTLRTFDGVSLAVIGRTSRCGVIWTVFLSPRRARHTLNSPCLTSKPGLRLSLKSPWPHR